MNTYKRMWETLKSTITDTEILKLMEIYESKNIKRRHVGAREWYKIWYKINRAILVPYL